MHRAILVVREQHFARSSNRQTRSNEVDRGGDIGCENEALRRRPEISGQSFASMPEQWRCLSYEKMRRLRREPRAQLRSAIKDGFWQRAERARVEIDDRRIEQNL